MATYLFRSSDEPLNVRPCESFCSYNNSDLKDGKLQCSCGENCEIFKWYWEPEGSTTHVLTNDDREVLFHPVYSSGTAAVRGNVILKPNMHHYWEIKILTKLYGTDVMIGIGTSKVLLNERQYKFCSMLGYNDLSWGYSYHGIIHHDKLIRKYGSVFGLGSIIGVHLDMTTGTLEYYLNRKSLGIAFRGLKGKDLYPMVCSTAAQSALKLTCSLSLEPTLEMKCLAVIKKHPKLIRLYHSIPGLSRLIKNEYFWLLPPKPKNTEDKVQLSFEDEAVLPLETLVEMNSSSKRKRMRTNKWGLYEQRSDPDHISYREFMRKISVSSKTNDGKCSCPFHHTVPKSPPSYAINDEQKIDNLIVDISDNFQDVFRNLSSTIETIREVSDVATSSSIYEDVDEVMENREESEIDVEVKHFNGL